MAGRPAGRRRAGRSRRRRHDGSDGHYRDAADRADPAHAIEAFAGVVLDGVAHAAIADALAVCAARRREADAVIDAGDAAANAVLADDPDESFVRIGSTDAAYHGTLESGVSTEDVDSAKPYEPCWTLTGVDMPDVVARALPDAAAAEGGAGALAAPAADGVASVKRRRSRAKRVPPA